jgi:hypothetical protein
MADEPVATDQGMTNDRTSESSTTARRAQRVGAACCRIRRGKRRVDSCEVYCHLGRERGPPHEKDGGLRLWSRLCPGWGSGLLRMKKPGVLKSRHSAGTAVSNIEAPSISGRGGCG